MQECNSPVTGCLLARSLPGKQRASLRGVTSMQHLQWEYIPQARVARGTLHDAEQVLCRGDILTGKRS